MNWRTGDAESNAGEDQTYKHSMTLSSVGFGICKARIFFQICYFYSMTIFFYIIIKIFYFVYYNYFYFIFWFWCWMILFYLFCGIFLLLLNFGFLLWHYPANMHASWHSLSLFTINVYTCVFFIALYNTVGASPGRFEVRWHCVVI